MSLIVLDASVAAKWFLGANAEPLVEEAVSILERYARGELRLTVPDLFFAEVGNVLWKAVRSGRFSKSLAKSSISDLIARAIPWVASANLLESAFEIATQFNRSLYDSLYLALAVELKAQFVTADERLVNALTRHFPIVWLGAY